MKSFFCALICLSTSFSYAAEEPKKKIFSKDFPLKRTSRFDSSEKPQFNPDLKKTVPVVVPQTPVTPRAITKARQSDEVTRIIASENMGGRFLEKQ